MCPNTVNTERIMSPYNSTIEVNFSDRYMNNTSFDEFPENSTRTYIQSSYIEQSRRNNINSRIRYRSNSNGRVILRRNNANSRIINSPYHYTNYLDNIVNDIIDVNIVELVNFNNSLDRMLRNITSDYEQIITPNVNIALPNTSSSRHIRTHYPDRNQVHPLPFGATIKHEE